MHMKVEEFISLHRNCGLKIKAIGEHFFNRQGWVNYSFPNLAKIPIDNTLIDSIKWKYLVTILLADLKRKNSYEFILDTNDYSLEKFAKKTRNRIRKSLQNCSFKRPGLEDMLTFGLLINQQTHIRQRKKDKTLTDSRHWNRYITALLSNDSVIILGAYYEGRMVGYTIAAELEGKYILFHAFIDRIDSEITDPMNGLLYTMINQLIEQNGSIKISYGLDSFLELNELNRFKNNMLFERIPVSRVYILNPFLLPFVKFIIFFYVHLPGRKSIKNTFIRKLIRLYQGHRLFYREYYTREQKVVEIN
jgi:hypothetical protein